jgi:hypothetical protein
MHNGRSRLAALPGPPVVDSSMVPDLTCQPVHEATRTGRMISVTAG